MPHTLGEFWFTHEETNNLKNWYLSIDPKFIYDNSKELIEQAVKQIGADTGVEVIVIYSAFEKGKYTMQIQASGGAFSINTFEELLTTTSKIR